MVGWKEDINIVWLFLDTFNKLTFKRLLTQRTSQSADTL